MAGFQPAGQNLLPLLIGLIGDKKKAQARQQETIRLTQQRADELLLKLGTSNPEINLENIAGALPDSTVSGLKAAKEFQKELKRASRAGQEKSESLEQLGRGAAVLPSGPQGPQQPGQGNLLSQLSSQALSARNTPSQISRQFQGARIGRAAAGQAALTKEQEEQRRKVFEATLGESFKGPDRRRQFQTESRPFAEQRDAAETIFAAVEGGGSTDSFLIVNQLIRMADPGGRVTEGETGLVISAEGLPARVKFGLEKLLNGGVLTRKQEADVTRFVKRKMDISIKRQRVRQKAFRQKAIQDNQNPRFVVEDMVGDIEDQLEEAISIALRRAVGGSSEGTGEDVTDLFR